MFASSNRLKSEALCQAAMAGNKLLFDEMKNYLNGGSSSQDIPDTLEGKVTFNDILEKFKECYQSLYNSASSKNAMVDLNCKVLELIESTVMSSI